MKFMSHEFKYADLLDDDVFKLVFGRESTKDVMIEFLNQVIADSTIGSGFYRQGDASGRA